MDDASAKVLSRFGLNCKSIKKVKAAYVCGTDAGFAAVEQTRMDAARLNYIHGVTARLIEAGFANIDAFFLTPTGEPYTVWDGETYIARRHINAKETDFGDEAALRRVLPVIGRMGEILRDEGPETRDRREEEEQKTVKAFESAVSLLNRVRKRVYRNKPFSDFDVEVMKRFDFYTRRLADWRDTALSSGEARIGGVCHNSLKEEHVLYDGQAVYITGFNNCGHGYISRDLADVLLRHLREGGRLAFSEACGIYAGGFEQSAFEIDKEDVKARMLYPARFLSLIERVYEKRRTWLPGTFGEKLMAVVGADEALEEYLNT